MQDRDKKDPVTTPETARVALREIPMPLALAVGVSFALALLPVPILAVALLLACMAGIIAALTHKPKT